MERINYFLEKTVNALFEINALTYLVVLIFFIVLTVIFQWILIKYYPSAQKKKLKSILGALFIGLPIIGVVFYALASIYLSTSDF